MNEPIVFKRSVLVGQLVLIQVLVPPLVAIGVLFGLSRLYDVKFDGEIRVLAVLVATTGTPEMSAVRDWMRSITKISGTK